MNSYRGFVLLGLLLGLTPNAVCAESETPPPGAPWQQDFGKAHREALKQGKPIFVSFTKTY